MGKLRALKLGITKGLAHSTDELKRTIDPKRRAMHEVLSHLKCLDCGHGSLAHTNKRPEFEHLSKADFREMVLSTGFPGSMGFHECKFLFCNECKHKSKDENLKDCPI